MAVWLVRVGSGGEREEFALQNGMAVIGWDELPDLTPFNQRDELDALCREVYADAKPKTVTN